MSAPQGDALRWFDAAAVARALDAPKLIETLRRAFAEGAWSPPRQLVQLDDSGARLAVMPVWRAQIGAVKLATLFPENPARCGRPAVQALVILFDGQSGTPLAMADGTEITLRRTAAASALAAGYLARTDARHLLMIGTGALAPHLIRAHASARPIAEVTIWGRSPAKAEALARRLAAEAPRLAIAAAVELEPAAGRADVISCATGAREPVLKGAWLSPGAHVDLVGGFSPDARESDDDLVRGARIVVDTRDGALAEAGDLLIPLAAGVIAVSDIAGELSDLCAGRIVGRTSPSQTTLFKSVGAAIEDLAAARLLLESDP